MRKLLLVLGILIIVCSFAYADLNEGLVHYLSLENCSVHPEYYTTNQDWNVSGTPTSDLGINGEINGSCYFKSADTDMAGSDELHVSAIVIEPNHRRLGVASGLVKYVMEKTDKPVTVDINNTNYKAISLFTSLGFHIVDKHEDMVKMVYKK